MSASGYRDIYSGILHKCGGRIKSWTKRWMVLRSDYCLYYYKDANKNHLGVISLRDPQFKIRVGQRSDISWPRNIDLKNTFALVTTPRVYFMYAETTAEADEWRKILEDTHQDLVEVARTKSFSGRRSTTVSEQTSLLSKSVNVGNFTSAVANGARHKAYTCTRDDSIRSNASSVFGRQLSLSASSEMDSSLLQGEGVESMYNVLQHPEVKALQSATTAGEGEGREGDGGEMSHTEGEQHHYSQLPRRTYSADTTRSDDYDYVLPPDAVATCPQDISVMIQESDRLTRMEWAEPREKGAEFTDKPPTSETSLESFYDVAHDVDKSSVKQPLEVGGAVYDVAREVDNKGAQQPLMGGAVYDVAREVSNNTTQQPGGAVYDVAREVDVKTVQQPLIGGAVYDVAREISNEVSNNTTQQPLEMGGAVYDEVKVEDKTPPTEKGGRSKNNNFSKTPPKMSALNQPLPSIPSSFTPSDDKDEQVYDIPLPPHPPRPVHSPHPPRPVFPKEEVVYELVESQEKKEDDMPHPPHPPHSPHPPHPVIPKKEVLYEPVESQEKKEDDIYSEVEFEEERAGRVEGGGKYVNIPSGGAKEGEGEEGEGIRRERGDRGDGGERPPSGGEREEEEESGGEEAIVGYVNVPSTGSNSPSTPAKDPSPPSHTPPPSPAAHTTPVTKPTPAPRHNQPRDSSIKTAQLPSSRSNESLSNGILHDGLPSNSDHSRQTPVPASRTSPQLPKSSSTTCTTSENVSSPSKPRSYSDAPVPSSPSIQPFQKRFSPPPCPRSQTSPRPPSPRSPRVPSPLISDRRASVTSDVVSVSSSEGSPESVHRQRIPSVKEKGLALFQRRQQEVATLSEVDSQRRKRSLTILRGVQSDDTLSPDDKVLFAETLREVESERMKASEEKFRWERERMQLEEERRELERERLRLQQELERTRTEILQS